MFEHFEHYMEDRFLKKEKLNTHIIYYIIVYSEIGDK